MNHPITTNDLDTMAALAFNQAMDLISIVIDCPTAINNDNIIRAAELIRAAALFQQQSMAQKQASGLIMPQGGFNG